jgi:hypothetical protein
VSGSELAPAILSLMIPIVALCIPIVRIMTKHQQSMTEMFRSSNNTNGQQGQEISMLREDMRQIRELVTSQSILIDDLRSEVRGAKSLQDQLNQSNNQN